jgi:urease alpha subunit
MKKLVFGLIATVMFGFAGNAQEKNKLESFNLTTTVNKETIKYDFKTLSEFEEGSDKIITETVENAQVIYSKADICTVSITMTVTVTIEGSVGIAGGSVAVTVTGSITASCADAVAAGKRLRATLVAMAQG